MPFIGPLTAGLCTKIGCRAVTVSGALMFGLGLFLSSYVTAVYQLFLTYSVLFGFGTSCCYYPSVLILSEYFSKRLVFANGIGLSGCGIGTLALVPLMNYLIDTSHWRETLRILSATSALLLLVGWIYFVVPAPLRNLDANSSTEQQKIFNMALLKNRAFVLWIISVGLVLFGFYIPYVHLVSRLSCGAQPSALPLLAPPPHPNRHRVQTSCRMFFISIHSSSLPPSCEVLVSRNHPHFRYLLVGAQL